MFLLRDKLMNCSCAVKVFTKISVVFFLTGSIVMEVSSLPLNGSAEIASTHNVWVLHHVWGVKWAEDELTSQLCIQVLLGADPQAQ